VITINAEQGSPEWHFARLGIPTASQFSRILTAKTRKPAGGRETYMHELLAEWCIGVPHSVEVKGYIDRGNELEDWAVSYYELQRNVTTTKVGVCLRDDRLVACSPDRLVGDDGGLEIKCPSAAKHVANMLDMTEDHFAQVQGNLWITGRSWWDLISYHPELPTVIVRIARDEEYMAALDSAMGIFLSELVAARNKLLALGAEPAESLAPDFVSALTSTETTDRSA